METPSETTATAKGSAGNSALSVDRYKRTERFWLWVHIWKNTLNGREAASAFDSIAAVRNGRLEAGEAPAVQRVYIGAAIPTSSMRPTTTPPGHGLG